MGMVEYITDNGFDLLNRMLSGESEIQFTRVEMGEGYPSELNYKKVKSLAKPIVSLDVDSVRVSENKTVRITAIFNNTELTEGFYYREKGIYATDGEKEILFSYANAREDAGFIDPPTVCLVEKKIISYMTQLQGTDGELKIDVKSGIYVSTDDFVEHVMDFKNPHNVSKEDVGLGLVDNTADKDKSVKHALSADTAKTTMYMQKVDLSDTSIYNVDTWYPVVGSDMAKSKKGYHWIKCNVTLNSETKPPWSTHNSGFSCNLELLTVGGQWGSATPNTIVLDYSYSQCIENPLGYTQITTNSRPVVFCRGGGAYFLYSDYSDNVWNVYTDETGYGGMTVKPMTSNPGIFNTKKSTVIADLDGTANRALADSNGNVITDTYALKKNAPIYKRYNVSSDKKLITSLQDNIADIISLTSDISPATIVFGQDWVLVGSIDSYKSVFSFVAFKESSTGQMYSGYCYKNKMNGIYEYTGTLKDV